jgi:hypothetical protein
MLKSYNPKVLSFFPNKLIVKNIGVWNDDEGNDDNFIKIPEFPAKNVYQKLKSNNLNQD